ncbi:hypothetical protein [Streptomyces sp. MH60]|uniref:hypothetical protein n=1 Tax=Streptomyces sp. MH60 TaxID=1940758 RepID=UPI000CEEC1FE|nr:hypothetical protein [Streptomyces sp. MH60]PPS89494.1 hypothetical protein BZZ08_01640 [Streptomyces sp. MH60]
MRAHFNRALLDREGNQVDTATIRLRVAGSTDLLTDTVYTNATGGATYTNPWEAVGGEVDFYLDSPTRLQIGITVGADPEQLWDDVDVLAVGADSSHPGTGADSTQVGADSLSSGQGSTSLGTGAQATADLSTALGYQTATSEAGSIAVGSQAAASQAGAIAVGQSALSSGAQATTLGDAAQAVYDHSTAIGAGAATDRPNQVRLGTEQDQVDIPGTVTLRSPGGIPFLLGVTDTGMLFTQKLPPYVPPTPPDEGGGE